MVKGMHILSHQKSNFDGKLQEVSTLVLFQGLNERDWLFKQVLAWNMETEKMFSAQQFPHSKTISEKSI